MDCSMPGFPVLYHLLSFAISLLRLMFIESWFHPNISSWELINWTSLKLKTSALQKMWRKLKDKPLGENICKRHILEKTISKIYEEFWKTTLRKWTTQWTNRTKNLIDMSPKKIYRWQISLWKDAPNHMPSGKWNKNIRNTTTHLLEWHSLPTPQKKQKQLTIINASKDVEQQGFSYTVGGNAKWYSNFGNQFSGLSWS